MSKRICIAFLVLLALPAAAQSPDGAGITVDLGGAAILHRTPVAYPADARTKNIQGTVVMDVTLDSAGNVSDLHVVSGPDELRRAVMQSVLDWHFAQAAAGAKRQISVTFKPPVVARQGVIGGVVGGGVVGGIVRSGNRSTAAMNLPRLKSIDVTGLPDEAKQDLLSSLPAHIGDLPNPETLMQVNNAIRQFDEHLTMSIMTRDDGMELRISAPGAAPSVPVTSARASEPLPDGMRIKVGPEVQAAKLVRKTNPVYPQLAKQARISGAVKLAAVVGKDGSIVNLTSISGHPLLVQAALDAVKNWAYQPTLLNGNPVEVSTEITVNFALADEPAQ